MSVDGKFGTGVVGLNGLRLGGLSRRGGRPVGWAVDKGSVRPGASVAGGRVGRWTAAVLAGHLVAGRLHHGREGGLRPGGPVADRRPSGAARRGRRGRLSSAGRREGPGLRAAGAGSVGRRLTVEESWRITGYGAGFPTSPDGRRREQRATQARAARPGRPGPGGRAEGKRLFTEVRGELDRDGRSGGPVRPALRRAGVPPEGRNTERTARMTMPSYRLLGRACGCGLAVGAFPSARMGRHRPRGAWRRGGRG